jgi:hypothetical protein
VRLPLEADSCKQFRPRGFHFEPLKGHNSCCSCYKMVQMTRFHSSTFTWRLLCMQHHSIPAVFGIGNSRRLPSHGLEPLLVTGQKRSITPRAIEALTTLSSALGVPGTCLWRSCFFFIFMAEILLPLLEAVGVGDVVTTKQCEHMKVTDSTAPLAYYCARI